MRWLHTQWPAGTVERLPEVREDGTTATAGLYVVGDLTGVPLLKFAADTGARAVRHIVSDAAFQRRTQADDVLDLVIVGASVSGMAAALEAQKHDLRFQIFEATEPFSTLVNFPKGKPIFTYPTDMTPAGELQFHEKAAVKEGLLEDLHEQTTARGIAVTRTRVERIARRSGVLEVHTADGKLVRAHRVIVGIGRSGNFRKLGVPGEERDKVANRLHDPRDYCGQNVLVVGGGDSALEAAIALGSCGAHVTLSYRKPEFSRPKPENVAQLEALVADPAADVAVEQPTSERVTTAAGGFLEGRERRGSIRLLLPSQVREIRADAVTLTTTAGEETIDNNAVFTMIGREPPLDFFRRSGVRIRGEWNLPLVLGGTLFLLLCTWVYHWKAGLIGGLSPAWLAESAADPATLAGTLAISASTPAFWYTLTYTLLITIFGIARIRRRKTPYIKWQTLTLMAIQIVPLFVLPEMVLPLLGHQGVFDTGVGQTVADALFPVANYGHGREYWRAYGFIFAWPLFPQTFFTEQPLWAWVIIGVVQTFVLIPLIIWQWGKGAYCGWICSCGAMAETLGDTLRHKMPHGPRWNRVNIVGQVVLALAVVLLLLRILGWVLGPDSWAAQGFKAAFSGFPVLNYKYVVGIMLAGVAGFGLYFWYSGRVWCRFACPLAALMHIYARFSRFRILTDKKKCISCSVCTSVCHQGIDVMNFANKGLPMADPQCVRCSACVQSCPTGVLSFGQIDPATGDELGRDPGWLAASPVQLAELKINGARARTKGTN